MHVAKYTYTHHVSELHSKLQATNLIPCKQFLQDMIWLIPSLLAAKLVRHTGAVVRWLTLTTHSKICSHVSILFYIYQF